MKESISFYRLGLYLYHILNDIFSFLFRQPGYPIIQIAVSFLFRKTNPFNLKVKRVRKFKCYVYNNPALEAKIHDVLTLTVMVRRAELFFKKLFLLQKRVWREGSKF